MIRLRGLTLPILMIALMIATITAGFARGNLARADTVWVASGGRAPVSFADVTILQLDNGQLIFRTPAGTEATRELDHVVRIELDNLPTLNAAEAAFADGQWARAAQAYQQTLDTTDRPWLRHWVAIRLLEAANHSGQFSPAVAGYIAAVTVDPARAVEHRPNPSDQPRQDLDTAAKRLAQALQDPDLAPDARSPLLSLLMEVHRAQDNTAEAARAANELIQRLDPQTDSQPSTTRQILADARLTLARLALDQHQFQDTIDQIQPYRPLFTTPAQQSAALFYLAEAMAGLAADSGDSQIHQDVALAYMRVVAHFNDQPDNPYVAEALLNVARIHEQRLGEPDTARRLYQQLAAQYKDHPAAEHARRRLEQ